MTEDEAYAAYQRVLHDAGRALTWALEAPGDVHQQVWRETAEAFAAKALKLRAEWEAARDAAVGAKS